MAELKKILFAFEAAEISDEIAPWVELWARRFEAELQLLPVAPELEYLHSPYSPSPQRFDHEEERKPGRVRYAKEKTDRVARRPRRPLGRRQAPHHTGGKVLVPTGEAFQKWNLFRLDRQERLFFCGSGILPRFYRGWKPHPLIKGLYLIDRELADIERTEKAEWDKIRAEFILTITEPESAHQSAAARIDVPVEGSPKATGETQTQKAPQKQQEAARG
jgi:hypothetical protein